ncbi:ABC transporter C family member 13 isoform X2 [Neltuma alba]|uniref:ABC transporter C family member 13 isoform X2 n=1 Tax=Neltuma alba TaxID=207710 RepID=UPI0010A43AE9|nr:ABC transporter C family member 13 isoform X2 [Prosopis alba]
MDKFLALICPNSPSVWDGKGFSACFEDMVLGFGLNAATIGIIVVLGCIHKSSRGIQRSDTQMALLQKLFLHLIPAVGACASLLDTIFLWKREINRHFAGYHKWFYSCSELMVWTNIILFSPCVSSHYMLCNYVLCYWWIMKPLFWIFHLLTKFPLLETSICVVESFILLLNITFGISINVIRIKILSSKTSSLEDPLLSNHMDLEEGCHRDLGKSRNFCDLMTFKFINPVMNHGVVKQLDFEDLLELPPDLDPSSCHDILFTCWEAQLSNNGSNPSLLRAVCCAYGWPYLRLGLLKVVNDCIGFAGPLLLNKLIRFLQQVNKWISKLIASATEKMMKQKDERIRRTGELLTYIRTLKMNAWELLFSGWLMETRSSEVKHLATRKYLDAWCVFFWATTPTLFSLFTFGLYALLGHQLDAAMVFTCLALFNTLISPLNSFPWVINGLIDAIVSSRRLSRFLSCPQNKSKVKETNSCSLPYHSEQPDSSQGLAVFVQDACCTWSSSDEETLNLVLNHVNLSLSRGSFVAVVGEVGSGKSSLLYSILGETRAVHGSIHSDGSVAYVPQVPWILSGTIRDNIIFGKNYDPKRYAETVQACALAVDISLMVGGDMTYIGEKGVNLSGGQRTRLALARALYHGSDVIMLDDVLSTVDAQVAQWILHNAILGPLVQGKTRLLCTHNIQAISSAEMVVIMDKGRIKWVGSPNDHQVYSYITFSPLNELDTAVQNQGKSCCTNSSTLKDLPDSEIKHVAEGAEEIIEAESRKEGKVEPGVYKNYAMYTGWFITVVICLSAVLMQASRNGNDLWLSFWVDTTHSSQTRYSLPFYLAILGLFCIINSFFTLVRAFSFAFGGLQAAIKVHNKMLGNLINAPVQFFDQTPGGRILNRFSSDLYTIDDSLPFIMNILLANFVGLLGIAVVLSYVQVFFLILLLPFWFIYSRLQFFYRSTSRELRRLDSVSRSPIYTSFTETLDGSSTIRAFKLEDLFFSKFTEHVTLYQKTSFTEIAASLWLSLRLQLLAASIISFIALMAVVGGHGSLPISFGTPGLVGLALSYAAPIVSLLGSFLTSFTETEKEMVSVERVLEYMDIPQEEIAGRLFMNPDWPNQGVIEFQNVTLKYKPSLPPALCNLSFTIAGGSQIGIIGRTGAGKSSVLNALFRLTPICTGSIFIDGINISNIPVRELRSRLAVVPQSPFLFEGSLRDNLDPFQVHDDLIIWNALEKCHVKEEVEAAGGLHILVKESGMSFSVGQRQLLCLARALLKSSKVLCLDECTANVDTQTASLLQSTIAEECKGITVITIAHRISTVLNMDNILILDHGNLAEQGNPQVLLKHESLFSSFAKASSM